VRSTPVNLEAHGARQCKQSGERRAHLGASRAHAGRVVVEVGDEYHHVGETMARVNFEVAMEGKMPTVTPLVPASPQVSQTTSMPTLSYPALRAWCSGQPLPLGAGICGAVRGSSIWPRTEGAMAMYRWHPPAIVAGNV